MPCEQRRLAAIVSADVAGYSRLMGRDESGTLAALKAVRHEVVDPRIEAYRGRIVKTTGDGLLLEFASAVDAVRCVVEIQSAMATHNADVPQHRRIEFRVGVNIGDIIVDGDDIFGDGVNVAARLQEIAQPGGVCVSESAHQQVRDKVETAFTDLGEQQVKNIARPVRIYRVAPGGTAPAAQPPLALPDKPSIAVLPFQNMSGDPEQEYFADGMVEDIITALSRFRSLFVIARNSSFTYKGRAVAVKQVGRELGVRYVLEGSVRKAADRVRITGQLIDAATGTHLWADRFDDVLENIFDLQDRITASVVGAIAPKLEQAEIERARRKPTGSLDAYDYFLRGVAYVYEGTRAAIDDALRLLSEAIALDPGFASAYAMAARCYTLRFANGWMIDLPQEIAEIGRLARRATELGKDDAVALCFGGYALARVLGDFESGTVHIDRALALNPNLAAAWNFSGVVRALLGQSDTAIDHLTTAMRLSPRDPAAFSMHAGIALACFVAGRYDDASNWGEKAMAEQPSFLPAIRLAAASNSLAGRMERARSALARARELDPDFRMSNLPERLALRRPEDLARYAEGLRKAGLPE